MFLLVLLCISVRWMFDGWMDSAQGQRAISERALILNSSKETIDDCQVILK